MRLSLWPGTSWSFEEEHFCDKHQLGKQFHRRWGSEGLLCPGIPSGCSWCLCRQFGERFCSLLMLIHHISSFQFLLTLSEVGELLFDLNSFCVVSCGMLSTGILAWYWLEMYLSKRHLPWIHLNPRSSGICSLETQSRKLRVVSHLISFVFHEVSQMSTLIYFQVAFPLARHWLKLWRRTLPWHASTCMPIPSALREWRPLVSRDSKWLLMVSLSPVWWKVL